MSTYSDYFHQRNLKDEDRKIVDELFDHICSMKKEKDGNEKDDFGRQADIIQYMATKMHLVCKSSFVAPFNGSHAVDYLVGHSCSHDVEKFHKQLLIFLEQAPRDKRMVCGGIRYSAKAHDTMEEDDIFGKEKVTFITIDSNTNNSSKFTIKVLRRFVNEIEDSEFKGRCDYVVTVAKGHHESLYDSEYHEKTILHYKVDNYLKNGREHKDKSYPEYPDYEYKINSHRIERTYSELRYFGGIWDNCFAMVEDNDYDVYEKQ